MSCPRGYLIPPPALRTAQVIAFVRRVESAARYAGPISLRSWYRDPARNAACGGVPGSSHLRGLAMDIAAASPARAAAAFRAVGLRVIDERDHLHVQV